MSKGKCQACGSTFDNLLCPPCSGEWRSVYMAERRAIRDALIERIEQMHDRLSTDDEAAVVSDLLRWFLPGGRFEVKGDVANPPQSCTSVEDSTQREATLDRLANEGRDHELRAEDQERKELSD